MRFHRFLVATALGLALAAGGWSSASAVTVTLTLSPAGPTTVDPGTHQFLNLVISTDVAFTLDNLVVDLLSPFESAGASAGFNGIFPDAQGGFSDEIALLLATGGIPLAIGDKTFNNFFDVFFDLATPPLETMLVDVKANLDNQGIDASGDAISNFAVFVTPGTVPPAPAPATLALVTIGAGLVALYMRARRRHGTEE